MFRKMRNVGIELAKAEAAEILKNNISGMLSLSGDDDYPYGVPVNYIYENDKIYFHCFAEGHKVDAMKRNPKVSFTVVRQDKVVPEAFTTLFISAIAFGKVRFLQDREEKMPVLIKIMEKYSGDFMESAMKYIDEEIDNCMAVEISIDHLTGKAGN